MYRLYRVFCATSWELEGERRHFYTTVGQVNETVAMGRGSLFVPVSLTNVRDKRPLQYTVEENIRDCCFYILALTGGWGPPERNFERDYRLALQYLEDPAMPMQGVAILVRRDVSGDAAFLRELAEAGIPHLEFDDVKQFDERVSELLRGWPV